MIWTQGKLGNVLTLNTNRITADTRFEIIQMPLQQTVETMPNKSTALFNNKRQSQLHQQVQHQTIINDLNYYHLRINNIQSYDENEYACETTINKRNDDQPNLQSLIYLKVTGTRIYFKNIFYLCMFKYLLKTDILK